MTTEEKKEKKAQVPAIVNFQCTINIPRAYDKLDLVRELMENWSRINCTNWVFQIEDPVYVEGEKYVPSNPHVQASLRLKSKARPDRLVALLFNTFDSEFSHSEYWKRECVNVSPTVLWNIESMNLKYCSKVRTRIMGPFMDPSFYRPDPTVQLNRTWQRCLLHLLRAVPDARSIINVIDVQGGCGKTTFQKHYYFANPCKVGLIDFSGNIGQVIAATVNQGPKEVYFCNLPFSLPVKYREERVAELYQALESIKDGFITSSYYGRGETLCFNSPHVIVFSNWSLQEKCVGLAADRLIELRVLNGGNMTAASRTVNGKQVTTAVEGSHASPNVWEEIGLAVDKKRD